MYDIVYKLEGWSRKEFLSIAYFYILHLDRVFVSTCPFFAPIVPLFSSLYLFIMHSPPLIFPQLSHPIKSLISIVFFHLVFRYVSLNFCMSVYLSITILTSISAFLSRSFSIFLFLSVYLSLSLSLSSQTTLSHSLYLSLSHSLYIYLPPSLSHSFSLFFSLILSFSLSFCS